LFFQVLKAQRIDKLQTPIKTKGYVKFLVFLGGLAGYFINFYLYRSELHDFGDFIKAGELIWNQQDPYSTLMYVNSPVSAVYVYFLSKVFFFLQFAVVIQILNIVGLYFFLNQILRPNLSNSIFLTFALLPFMSPARALFANVQVTGLVLGILAFAIALSRQNKPEFLIAIPMWMAAELKPQMALPIILILVFERRLNMKRIAFLSSYLIVSHAIINIRFGSFLDLEWIRKLMRYSSASYKEGYEISYWKPLAIYTGQTEVAKILSLVTIVIFILCIINFSRKGNVDYAILMSLFFPLQNSYLHLYDLVPLALVLTAFGLKNKSIIAIAPVFLFAQIFVLNLSTQLIVGLLFLISFIIVNNARKNVLQNIALVITTTLFSVVSYFAFRGVSEELQIVFSLVIPVTICAVVSRHPLRGLLKESLSKPDSSPATL
jgi:hypothetical protein